MLLDILSGESKKGLTEEKRVPIASVGMILEKSDEVRSSGPKRIGIDTSLHIIVVIICATVIFMICGVWMM